MKKFLIILVALIIPYCSCFAEDIQREQRILNLANILESVYITDYSDMSEEEFINSITGAYFCEYSNISRVYNGSISIEKLFDLYASQLPGRGYIFLLVVNTMHYFTLTDLDGNIVKVLRANDIITTNELYQGLMTYLTPRISELGMDATDLKWFAFLAQKESDKAKALSYFYDKISKAALPYDTNTVFLVNTWYYPNGL